MEALVHACEAGEVPGAVVAVVSDRECTGLKLSADRGIATEILEPRDFASREEWSGAFADLVEAQEPDLVVSAGFMRILAPVFVERFFGKLINLHPSLLPSFPGAHAVQDALEARVKVTGTTVHFVDYEVDHGPILLQEEVPVENSDTEETLHERIKAVEHRLLPQACRLLLEGRARLEGGRVVLN